MHQGIVERSIIGAVNAVFLHAIDQRVARNPQQLRRPSYVALRLLQRLANGGCRKAIEIQVREALPCFRVNQNEILGLENVALGKSHGSLQRSPELRTFPGQVKFCSFWIAS